MTQRSSAACEAAWWWGRRRCWFVLAGTQSEHLVCLISSVRCSFVGQCLIAASLLTLTADLLWPHRLIVVAPVRARLPAGLLLIANSRSTNANIVSVKQFRFIFFSLLLSLAILSMLHLTQSLSRHPTCSSCWKNCSSVAWRTVIDERFCPGTWNVICERESWAISYVLSKMLKQRQVTTCVNLESQTI